MAKPQQPPTQRFLWQLLDPGQLRNQVALSTPASGSPDSFGQEPPADWTVYLTTWAAIRQLSGRELYQGDEFTSAAQVRITIRWPGPGITVNPGDRVTFGTHIYVIQIVDNVELRDIVLNLNCLEIDGTS